MFDVRSGFEYTIRYIQHLLNYPTLFSDSQINTDYEYYVKMYKKILQSLVKKLLDAGKKEYFLNLMNSNSKLQEGDIEFLVNDFMEKEFKHYFYNSSTWFNSPKKELIDKKKEILNYYKEKYPRAT